MVFWLLPVIKAQEMNENDYLEYIPVVEVKKCRDFEITGKGVSPEWDKSPWLKLWKVQLGEDLYTTKAKVLYSDHGIYFLVNCVDKKLSATIRENMGDLYTEDVVEVFIWPNIQEAIYFEYEISPLDKELVLMVPNTEGTFHGWLPWHYEAGRKIIHKTTVQGGAQEPGAAIEGWTTEFYIPFALLTGLKNVPPTSGMQWRMNICRIDYDGEEPIHWTWSRGVGNQFHNYQSFGIFRFE